MIKPHSRTSSSRRAREANDKIAQLTRARPRELDKLYDKLG